MEKRIPTNGPVGGEKSVIKSLGFISHGMGTNPGVIDVGNGKIVRIRPLHYDSRYDAGELKLWRMEARNREFRPGYKALLPPFSLAYKKRVYSPNRILYPLKRVDWHPEGERNQQNRGKSKFVRISWQEALDIIATEIRRIHQAYDPYAILLQGDGHGETKVVHGPHGCGARLLELLGGYTAQARNADSWEGWYWGARHVWGMDGTGLMAPQTNCFKDTAENTDMILFWGCDPETTPLGFGQQMPGRFCYWFTELGIKQVYICPDLNYGAAIHADKWIPVLPNTDAALQLAVAFTWIMEDRYDKAYVATHTVGFDRFSDYVTGEEDGVPKTPAWAAEKCGVPEWTIKALARAWANGKTTIAHGCGGSYIRSPYASEPARLEVMLLAMQGLGKPGVHQLTMTSGGLPGSLSVPRLHQAFRGEPTAETPPRQFIPKTLVPEAILNPPISWYGTTRVWESIENQFEKYSYPAEGCSEIHMIWTDSPCWIGCWNGGNRMIEAMRSPNIEFILAQHPWMENDCLFADLILPVSTKFEQEDIGSDAMGEPCKTLFPEDRCIDPIGESKSDYEIVCMIAKRFGLLGAYTEGRSIQDWIRFGFETSGAQEHISYEEFREKGYYVAPTDPDWEKRPAGLSAFYKDPEANPLKTPSGKIEFYSERLAQLFPDDEERPPTPHWIERSCSHDERNSGEKAKTYPLLMISNHPHWRVHVQFDDVSWFREIRGCKVKGPDGYLYEPVWINPIDADERKIKDGDIIKIFNERGAVLGGACISQRIIAGAVYQDHGARYDPIVAGELDRGGSNNTICPSGTTSKNAAGEATSGFLVEVQRVDIIELAKRYPEAFARRYDPHAGLVLHSWLEG